MADARTIRRLTRYRAWADGLTYEAVAALPPGEATKERPTLFKTIIGTLNHNLVIDRIWRGHLEGRDHGFKARNVVLYADPGVAGEFEIACGVQIEQGGKSALSLLVKGATTRAARKR